MITPTRLRDLFRPGLPRPVVVFDLDGTLIEDETIYDEKCWRAVSAMSGLPFDVARDIMRKAYSRTGNGIKGLVGVLDGWTEEKAEQCSVLASESYLADLESHLPPQTETLRELELLATHTSALCVLTANKRHHAERVLHVGAVRPPFHTDLVLGRDCTQGYRKLEVQAYEIMDARIAEAMPWLAPATPRVMVEDIAANLPAAKQRGNYYTVHMGNKELNGHAHAVDYTFSQLSDVFAELNAGLRQSGY